MSIDFILFCGRNHITGMCVKDSISGRHINQKNYIRVPTALGKQRKQGTHRRSPPPKKVDFKDTGYCNICHKTFEFLEVSFAYEIVINF